MNEEELKLEVERLRKALRASEEKLQQLQNEKQHLQNYGLNNNEVLRYSRQMIMPDISVDGQVKLKNSSVLVVGAGGLGCPSVLYLAGAGVGKIGIVDYDQVEINNLHRQLLYSEHDIGTAKVEAAKEYLTRLNKNIKVVPYQLQLDSSNALEIVKQYDLVIDATDNPATRYLLNDACVICKKPLVSGSALKFEGQLTVYNYNGPCYRCIFPKPPPPETVTNCGDGGVLGAAVGVIGVLQALEAVKIIVGMPGVLTGRMLIFDGSEATFRNIRLRPKSNNCEVCGDNPSIERLIDYEQFCRAKAVDKNPNLNLLQKGQRVSVEDYNNVLREDSSLHVLIDVRSPEEYKICHLDNSINVPYTEITKKENLEVVRNEIEKKKKKTHTGAVDVFVMCRRGNDSQRAVQFLSEHFLDESLSIKDIVGGIHNWARKIDNTIPIY